MAVTVLAIAYTRTRTALRLTLGVLLTCAAVLFFASGIVSGASQTFRLDTVQEAGGRALAIPLVIEQVKEQPSSATAMAARSSSSTTSER